MSAEPLPLAGLEVAPPLLPEAIHEVLLPEAVHGAPNPLLLETVHETPDADGDEKPAANKSRYSWRSRQLWLVLAVALLVIIVIVVGAALGKQLHKKVGPTPTATATSRPPSATPTPTPHQNVIRERSRLAVTGWNTGTEANIRLFYQGDDSFIRMSAYSSSGNWSSPQTIVKAKAGTPIAATSINHTLVGWGDQDVQVQLYYLTDHDVIQAWDLVRSNSANGSLSPLGYKADPNSSLVSYWPSLVLQDDKGNLEEIFFSVNPPAHWGNQSFDARGLVGSDLVELPTTTNYSALSVFYQRDDGKLAEWGWAQGPWSAKPTIGPIPPRAPLGGLAVARSGSAKSEIYILWQDATGDIQVYWTNDQTGWKGPSSFPALRAADNGTAIACLTPSTWYDVPMSQDPRLSRCYFQVGGVLREVALSGSDWKIVGNVPMS